MEDRKNNDCLLLYSGGKDSTLAAIRLYKAGYNVHFIHFDNGHMLDQNKPYLTFLETFNKEKDSHLYGTFTADEDQCIYPPGRMAPYQTEKRKMNYDRRASA